MPKFPNLLTSREACEILRIDRSTLSRWVQAGKVKPAMKLPGTRGAHLFARSVIERLRVDNTISGQETDR